MSSAVPLTKDELNALDAFKAAVNENLIRIRQENKEFDRQYKNDIRKLYPEFREKLRKRGWKDCLEDWDRMADESPWIREPLESKRFPNVKI